MTNSQALPTCLDRLGDWNPQLLRELKRRLSWRSVLITVALVAIVQVLFMMSFIQRLPSDPTVYSSYCLKGLQSWSKLNGTLCQTDWSRWWWDVFSTLNWAIPWLVYLPTVYFLISDINQEVQRGTMNFLRLSPRSSQTILIGKLLGVPCLTYLALILVIPLHLLCGIRAGISPNFFLSYYSNFLLFGAVLMTGALFIGFSNRNANNKGSSAVVSSGVFIGLLLAGAIVIPAFWQWNTLILWDPYLRTNLITDRLNWFFLPINRNPIVTHLFTFTNLAIMTGFLWAILQRVFQNPKTTQISKLQSYWLVSYFVLLIIGFDSISSKTNTSDSQRIALLEFVIPWLLIGLIFALSTDRQTWFEWIRYRKVSQVQGENSGPNRPSRSDLIFGEKSPGLTAIGLNLLIVAGIILTALVFLDSRESELANWLGLMLTVTLSSTYALLVQWMLMLKTQKRSTWAIGSLFFAVGLPLVMGGLFMSFSSSSKIGIIMLLCSPWYRPTLGSSSYAEEVTISLLIQSIAILFLASRVWAEWRKMSRST